MLDEEPLALLIHSCRDVTIAFQPGMDLIA